MNNKRKRMLTSDCPSQPYKRRRRPNKETCPIISIPPLYPKNTIQANINNLLAKQMAAMKKEIYKLRKMIETLTNTITGLAEKEPEPVYIDSDIFERISNLNIQEEPRFKGTASYIS